METENVVIPDDPPPTVYRWTCNVCGMEYASDDDPIRHDMQICFDRAFAQRAKQLVTMVEAVRDVSDGFDGRMKNVERGGQRMDDRIGKLENVENKAATLERIHAEQVKLFAKALEVNAQKVGESISLKVQHEALKLEHSKCPSYVGKVRVKELELELSALRASAERWDAQATELRKERDALQERVNELEALVPEEDEELEEEDEEEQAFTLDDVRDVIRAELRKTGRPTRRR